MKSELLADWYDARVANLREWKTVKLLTYARELGFTKMNAAEGFSYAAWIAEQELRRMRAELGAEPGETAVPGAVLDDDEADVPLKYDIDAEPPFEARTDEQIANNYHPTEPELDHLVKMRQAIDEFEADRDYAPAEVSMERGGNPYGITTSSGWFIYEVILPEVLRKFFTKNSDYGDNHRTGLGLRAEFVGLHRKVEKLKTAIWDGQELNHEGPEEMIHDLIGQCLIMLDLMNEEELRRRERGESPPGLTEPKAY